MYLPPPAALINSLSRMQDETPITTGPLSHPVHLSSGISANLMLAAYMSRIRHTSVRKQLFYQINRLTFDNLLLLYRPTKIV